MAHSFDVMLALPSPELKRYIYKIIILIVLIIIIVKETLVQSTITRILPYAVAQSLCPTGFTMAHLYGLPNAHREKLAMRSVLSATHTYNYASENWLDYKLKPLSLI